MNILPYLLMLCASATQLVGETQRPAEVGDYTDGVVKSLQNALKLSEKIDNAVKVLETDVYYLDGGTEGIAILIGSNSVLFVVIPAQGSHLAKKEGSSVWVSSLDSLTHAVEVVKNTPLHGTLVRYLKKAKAPNDGIAKRLRRIVSVLEK